MRLSLVILIRNFYQFISVLEKVFWDYLVSQKKIYRKKSLKQIYINFNLDKTKILKNKFAITKNVKRI